MCFDYTDITLFFAYKQDVVNLFKKKPVFCGALLGLGHNMGHPGEGVRLALLALSLVSAFAQAVADNANKTSLTPLTQSFGVVHLMTKPHFCFYTSGNHH